MLPRIDSPALSNTGHSLELSRPEGSPILLHKGESIKVAVKANENFHLKKRSADTGQEVIALREGDDLVLQYADGTRLSLDGFYASPEAAVELSLGEGLSHTICSADAGVPLLEGSVFVYSYGDQTALMGMASGDASLQTAIAKHISLSGLPHFAEAATGTATDAAAGATVTGSGAAEGGIFAGMSTMTATGLGVLALGGGIAIAAGGGGGGSGDTTPPSATASIDTVHDDAGTLTGGLSNGSVTDDTSLSLAGAIEGTLESGDVVAVYDGTTRLGTATVEEGRWSYTDTTLSHGDTPVYTVRVEDAAGNHSAASDSVSLTIDTTAPVFSGAASLSVEENTTAAVYTATTTPDGNGAYVYGLSGEDAALFDIDPSSGVVTFKNSPDYETPADADGDNVYYITVTAADAAGNTASQNVAITVTDIGLTVDPVAGDDIINASESFVISGTNEAGSTVTVNGSPATVTGTTWSWDFTVTEGDRSYGVTVASDGASVYKTFTVDTTADAGADATLTINDGDGYVNAAEQGAVGFSVSGLDDDATALVTFSNGMQNITVDVEANGTFTVDLSSLIDAGINASLAITDAAGNTTYGSGDTTTKDTAAPAVPTIDTPVADDDVINMAEKAAGVTVTGTTEEGSTVTVNGHAATVSGTSWSYTLNNYDDYAPMGEGEDLLSVVSTDAAGNMSVASHTISIDTTPPAAGTLSFVNLNDTGSDDTPDITSDNAFTLSLSGNEAGASVVYEVSTDGGATWAPTTAAQSGLSDNTYQFRAVVTDAAGNSAASNVVNVTVDTLAPAAGTLSFSGLTDTGSADTPPLTADNTFDLSLSGNEAGSNVVYQVSTDDGATWASTTAAQTAVADNDYLFRAVVTDAAGNSALSNTLAVTVETTPPVATVSFDMYAFDDAGTIIGGLSSGSSTDDTTPRFTGSISGALGANEVIALYDGETRLGDTLPSYGSWSFTPAALSEGAHSFTAVVENTSTGLKGTPSSAFTLTVDTQAPTATAAITGLFDDAGDLTGSITEGDTIDDNTPTLSGTLSEAPGAGEVVAVYANGNQIGNATVSDLTWTFTTPTLGSGTYDFTARVIDAVGNAGTPGEAFTVTISTSPVATVSFDMYAFDDAGTIIGGLSSGSSTDDTTPRFTGSISGALGANEVIALYDGETRLGDTLPSYGSWSFTPAALSEGAHSFTAVVENTSTGLKGTPSSAFTLTVDTQISAPDFWFNDNTNQAYVWNIDPDASWQYSTDGGATWQTGSGCSFIVSDTDGTYDVAVRQTDTVGNVSPVTAQTVSVTSLNGGAEATITDAHLIAPLSAITAFPAGTTFTDGEVSVTFTSTTEGTITSPEGESFPLLLSEGTASVTVGDVTYHYRLLADSDEVLVLGTTSADITDAMNIGTDGPPSVLTLAKLTGEALPAPEDLSAMSGTLTFYNTDADDFGDYNNPVSWTLDFATHTMTETMIDGAVSVTPFTISGGNTIHLESNDWSTDLQLLETTSNDYSVFSYASTDTWSWGEGSAQGALSISGYLSEHDGYLWGDESSENSGRLIDNGDGTYTFEETDPDETDTAPATLSDNTLTIDWGNEHETYSVEDGAIIGVYASTGIFAGAPSAPFEYNYTLEAYDDPTPPELVSATVYEDTVTLTYDDALDTGCGQVPTPLFTIEVDGAAAVIENAWYVNDHTVRFQLSAPVEAGANVTLGYTDPTASNDANVLQNAYGTDAQSLSDFGITNQTGIPRISITSAPVQIDELTLQPNPALYSFTLTRDGDVSGVSSVHWSVSGEVEGADFVRGVLPSGTVTFAAGETSKIITLRINADYLIEGDETLTITLSDPANAILGSAEATTTITDDDFPYPVSILTPAHFSENLPLSDLSALPSEAIGKTYRVASDATVTFTSTTEGTINIEGEGTVPFTISGGALQFSMRESSYSYKLLSASADWNSIVLGTADADLSGTMNDRDFEGPPSVLTLVSTALAPQSIPATGSLSLYGTETEGFGDWGNPVRIDIDFAAHTIALTDIAGNTSTIPFMVEDDTIRFTDGYGTVRTAQLLSSIDNATGSDYYIFAESVQQINSWGSGSAGGAATISGWLLANEGYLWQENGTDYNGNGTTDDYARILDTDGTLDYSPTSTLVYEDYEGNNGDVTLADGILTVSFSDWEFSYEIDTADNAVVQTHTYFTSSSAYSTLEPFAYDYVTELDLGGIYAVALHDGMSLSLSELGAYSENLFAIDTIADTEANEITVDSTDIFLAGMFAPGEGPDQILMIIGGQNDTVNLGSGWTLADSKTSGSITYDVYASGDAQIMLAITQWTQVI